MHLLTNAYSAQCRGRQLVKWKRTNECPPDHRHKDQKPAVLRSAMSFLACDRGNRCHQLDMLTNPLRKYTSRDHSDDFDKFLHKVEGRANPHPASRCSAIFGRDLNSCAH